MADPKESPVERLRRLRQDPNWRARAGDAARKALEGSVAKNERATDEDKLVDAATMQATQGGVPVQWHNGDRGRSLPVLGRQASVVRGVTPAEVENYAAAATRTCGTCRFFDLQGGQRKMMRERFAERLVLEQEWQLHHMGAPLDHMGVCKASGGTMACSTVSNADKCASYRPKSRLFG